MRIQRPALAVTALAVMVAAVVGCGTQNAPDGGAQNAASGSGTGSAALTQMPTTTTINGKTVPLKVTPSGLRYYDLKAGKGPHPKQGQTVSVQYTGTLLDGVKFDSSNDHGGQPLDFQVGTGQVIQGWDEGIAGMRVGGHRRLVVPGNLAYGANPPTDAIPPNATLVFDVELVAVK